MAQIIKVRFLKDGQPRGNAYTYYSKEIVKSGDLVQINSSAKGIVKEVDIPEEAIKDFKDKVKFIYGKAVEENRCDGCKWENWIPESSIDP